MIGEDGSGFDFRGKTVAGPDSEARLRKDFDYANRAEASEYSLAVVTLFSKVPKLPRSSVDSTRLVTYPILETLFHAHYQNVEIFLAEEVLPKTTVRCLALWLFVKIPQIVFDFAPSPPEYLSIRPSFRIVCWYSYTFRRYHLDRRKYTGNELMD